MFWSKAFIPTLKEAPEAAESISHKLMLRAGLVRMLMSGVYSYLPLGLRVLKNIQQIVREEMSAAGASELLLPALQPKDLWLKSGRDKDMGEVMIKFTDRRGRAICLGPTHEEVITDLVKDNISSYRQLPVVLYQIQTKFRDEMRPRFGLVRSCEFIMKDAYSFDKDEAGLNKNYSLMLEAYKNIFRRCGLDFLVVEADSGVMGGKVSHEFMVPAKDGEDIVLSCPTCKIMLPHKDGVEESLCHKCKGKLNKVNAIEVGHIFQLGTKYTSSLGAKFIDEQGKFNDIIMGCYGIGVSRLISAVIEQNNDASGIIWPREVSPFQVIVLPLDVTDQQIMSQALGIYELLRRENIEALLDDRDERAGIKFKDADLIGIPISVVLGKKLKEQNKIELVLRKSKSSVLVDIDQAINNIKEAIANLK